MRFGLLRGGLSVGFFCVAATSCGGQSSHSVGADGTTSAVAGGPSNSSAGSSAAGTLASGGASSTVVPVLNLSDAGSNDDAPGSGVPSGNVCGSTCPAGITCSPEVCDGVDNNCDGIVDNVDKNGDGICDCLLIATLGAPGMWGQGDVFSTWLSARSNTGATNLADQTLTPALLAKYEVIVAQDVSGNHSYSADEVQALQAWVNAGGGFMTLIGYNSQSGEESNVNQLLAPFDMSYGDMPILGKTSVTGSTVAITDWVPHPIDQGVTAVGVDNGYEPLGSGKVIATGGGFTVGLAQEVSAGHVFVWADEWITYDSEWEQHPDYQVQLFWVNSIKWLTAANKCQVPVPPVFPK